jgi:glycosyltransferase involved in cell wall biosynthesis
VARIAIVRQGYVPLDARVRSEVDALVAAGHEVDVLCLRWPGEARREHRGGLTIRRLSFPNSRSGWPAYVMQYGAFFCLAFALVTVAHLRRPYDIVQVNSMPDALVFSAVVPRLLGARVLLDLHECMPEFLGSKFNSGPDHPLCRVVAWLEQASIRFADAALTCTEPMRRTFIRRGARAEKIGVMMGSFGLNLSRAEPPSPARTESPSPAGGGGSGWGRPFTLICHGTIEERYGLDTLVRAIAILRDEIPDLRLAIYGDGSYRPAVQALVGELDVERQVSFSNGWVPMDELVRALNAADAGVVAIKKDRFRDLALCNKMFDFIGLHKPAIVSRTRSVEEYFDDSCFRFFRAGDEGDLARAIRDVYADPGLREALANRAAAVAHAYSWPLQRERYLQIIDGLARREQPAQEAAPRTERRSAIGP